MNADLEPTIGHEDEELGEASGPGPTTGEPEEGMQYSADMGVDPDEWMAKDMAPADLED